MNWKQLWDDKMLRREKIHQIWMEFCFSLDKIGSTFDVERDNTYVKYIDILNWKNVYT